jgi:L-alanine-DL-glutamate epimerase-like enolase superfamily enzyme
MSEESRVAVRFNKASRPSDLRITDVKICNVAAPHFTTLIKIETNQGIEGYGQTREGGSALYALMLKRLILGENPCDVDKLFRRIKQFGSHSHQAGGVSGIEIALWDIAGKAYGIPVWRMLGGKFRDEVRIYCDTDVDGKPTGSKMGAVLKERIEKKGYTFMKIDLAVDEILADVPGTISCPAGYLETYKKSRYAQWKEPYPANSGLSKSEKMELRLERQRRIDITDTPGDFSGLHVTEKGLDLIEEYVSGIRDIIGYEIPVALDHFGHIGKGDCIRLAERIEPYCFAWLEDMLPWYMTDQLAEISRHSTTPLCTGEDIYLKENFVPLLEKQAVSIIHPDLLSAGGIMETKKIGDLAQDYGVPMAIHMNETPVAAMAAVQVAASTENFYVMEFHHNDCSWWADMVRTYDGGIIEDGFIKVPDAPGIGIEALNEEVLAEHLHDGSAPVWLGTDEWDHWYAIDQVWL